MQRESFLSNILRWGHQVVRKLKWAMKKNKKKNRNACRLHWPANASLNYWYDLMTYTSNAFQSWITVSMGNTDSFQTDGESGRRRRACAGRCMKGYWGCKEERDCRKKKACVGNRRRDERVSHWFSGLIRSITREDDSQKILIRQTEREREGRTDESSVTVRYDTMFTCKTG